MSKKKYPTRHTAPEPQSPASRWLRYGLLPALLLLATVFLALHPITDPDFWYHAAFGRETLRAGAIPRTDIFSHTSAGHYWISSGWLPDVLLHALYETFGTMGPVLLVVACVGAGVLTTYLVAVRAYGNAGTIGILLLTGLLASYPRFNPRPDIFSQLLIVPLVLVLAGTEQGIRAGTFRGDRLLWALPVVTIAWANLHALFFLGLVIIAFYAAWRAWLWNRTGLREHLRALVPCGLCGVVWLANPYGYRMLTFIYDNATLHDVGRRVFELKPLLTAELFTGGIPIHLLLALLLLFVGTGWFAWNDRANLSGWRVAALALLMFLALVQRRQIGLAAAALPALLIPSLGNGLRVRPWVVATASTGLLLLIIGMRTLGILEISRGMPRAGIDCQWFPCNAAQFLKQNPPPPHLFHDLYTGGYLLHELGPSTKVFIDGRLEIYHGQVWQDYFGPPDGRMTIDELFNKYGVNTCLLDIRGTSGNPGHTANRLAQKQDWQLIYFDDQYAVFVRKRERTTEYLRGHGYRWVNPLNWNILGAAMQDVGNHAAALAEARRAVDQAPGAANAHAALAMVLYNLGQPTEADKHLRQAQQIDPTMAVGPPR